MSLGLSVDMSQVRSAASWRITSSRLYYLGSGRMMPIWSSAELAFVDAYVVQESFYHNK